MKRFVIFILFSAFSYQLSAIDNSAYYYEYAIHIADSLYKNYKPQSNFKDVKAAVEFFDSIRLSKNNRFWTKETEEKIQLKNPVLLCAKAHYFHAVGLTERNDIVGACEHYFIALEMMKDMMAKDKGLKAKGKKSVDNTENYEKIRFAALIYTRLGELYYNNNYYELATALFINALNHTRSINDTLFESIILKYIGNTYHITNDINNALSYYYESLKVSTDESNYIDIQKNIAQILHNKGDKDSAYYILKDNIRKTDIQSVYDAYCYTLGEMYYNDNIYDSAIHYLERSFESEASNIKFASAKTLYSLFNSINDTINKSYYCELFINFSNNEINGSIERNSLQKIYNEYIERKHRKHENELEVLYTSTFSLIIITAIIVSLFLFIKYKRKNKNLKLQLTDISKDCKEKDSVINDLIFKRSITEGVIKSKNEELRKKEETIRLQKLELSEIKDKITNVSNQNDINAFYNSEICKRILSQNKNRILPLDSTDITLLLNCADTYLNNFTVRIRRSFNNLKKEDLCYLCLILLRLDNYQMSLLLNKNRKTIWDRMKKIKERMNLDEDTNIHDVLSKFI